LRLLHAIDRARLGSGAAVQMLEAAAELSRRGHEVTVAARPGDTLEAACARLELPFLGLLFRHEADLVSAWRLRPRLRRMDVVHVHKGTAHAVVLEAAAGLGRLPAVVVNRGVSFPLTVLNRWKYRHPRVRAVVAVAEAVRRVVIASSGVRAERVHTIHAGTDPVRFDPTRVHGRRVRRELGIDDDELLIGQVSSRHWKGWRDLVAAFSVLARERAGCSLLLADCEPAGTRREIAALVAEVGLSRRVHTVGFRHDLPDVLAACDIVVDASWDGTGITGVVREAMMLERAVVATDIGGNGELVIHGEVGLLVPAHDPQGLAEALDRLLGDDELRRTLGRRARQRVLTAFTTARRVDLLENLYRKVVG
jgi:glycosyltransferase involved in cell wall biosynthesis